MFCQKRRKRGSGREGSKKEEMEEWPDKFRKCRDNNVNFSKVLAILVRI